MSIAVSVGTALLATIFGSIGLVGVLTDDGDAIKSVPWASASFPGNDVDAFLGVKGFYIDTSDQGWVDFEDGNCADVKDAAMGTGALGWIFLVLASIIALVRVSGNTSPTLITVNLVLMVLAFLMMLVAMGVWVNGCYNSDDFDAFEDSSIGAGLGLWIVGWIFALISSGLIAYTSFTGEASNVK
jgi:hypothetical protein